ncbi:MAG: nuclear transport factor 2 family protein [Burkholderiales bacterium]|nr:nuclear transport factor 2 family protein [Burkholderiales bacterium]
MSPSTLNDVELLNLQEALERALATPATRRDATRVLPLLHPEAQEVGRSGRCFNRVALLDLLATSPLDDEAVHMEAFTLQRLSTELALLRYRNRRGEQATERSSLWQWHEGAWRLRFHQGTPTS